ncbi:HpcH/HpaI aldolase/citrate lyase family protein [Tersicoccus sp. MR15.9]|uniref:HpcH/HpaI aldolase family protein n=1 Tax=Tersicoccus mangrovi TaxID=3121635 RepID=UPI002FE58E45
MPIRVEEPRPTLAAALAAADRPLVGMWVCSGSALVAEICAGSGVDWLLVDVEHGPNTLTSTLAQLQAVAAYDVVSMVRVPWNDPVQIKQYLDAGAQNLLVPMVDTAEAAAAAVAAIRYPGTAGAAGTGGNSGAGMRGVGAALGRSSRWGRIPDYLARASNTVSLTVQIETGTAVENVEQILAVDGVDAIFLGPSDLAASLGLLGQQEHPDVLAAVERCVAAGRAAGKPVGINAFNPERARAYTEGGVAFVSVGSDVTLLARGSEGLAGVLG